MQFKGFRRMLLLLACVVLLVAGCSADSSIPKTHAVPTTVARAATAGASKSSAELLFVVRGHDARAARAGKAWTLTTAVVSDSVTWFTDRPLRKSSHVPADRFVDGWAGYGFGADPPNAALTGETNGKQYDIVVELRDPTWDATRREMTFTVTPLDKGTALSSSFDDVSLFIDDANPSNTVTILNTNAAQRLEFVAYSGNWPLQNFEFPLQSSFLTLVLPTPTPGVASTASIDVATQDYVPTYDRVHLEFQWDAAGTSTATSTCVSCADWTSIVGPNGQPQELPNLSMGVDAGANYVVNL